MRFAACCRLDSFVVTLAKEFPDVRLWIRSKTCIGKNRQCHRASTTVRAPWSPGRRRFEHSHPVAKFFGRERMEVQDVLSRAGL